MEYRVSDDEEPKKKIDLMNLSPPSNDLKSKLTNYKRVDEKVRKSLRGSNPGSHSSKTPIFLDRFIEEKSLDKPARKKNVSLRQSSVLVQSQAFALNESVVQERPDGKSKVELLQSELRASNISSSRKKKPDEGTWRIETRLHSRKN